MHHNFYFLRQLTTTLRSKLAGAVISEVYSQSKDELILRFEIGSVSFFVRANLTPEISCLSFTGSFQRAKKNSVDLFPETIGRRVVDVKQFSNERSFAIRLSNGIDILFKMHANRSNVIVCNNGKVLDVFRKNLVADLSIDMASLDRDIDWSLAAFRAHAGNLKHLYFTFGKVVWRYLEERGFSEKGEGDQWQLLQETLSLLNDPAYHITLIDGKPALSLLETGEIKKTLDDPLEAATEYFYFFTQKYAYAKEKAQLLNALAAKLEAGNNYCVKNTQKLNEVLGDNHYKIWADLIMANLHAIPTGAERIVVENFFDNLHPVEIKLKSDLTPQRNAELYYKKSKNQHIEIERLERSIAQKRAEVEVLRKQMADVDSSTDLKSLRSLRELLHPEGDGKESGPLPYHEFHFRDFRIWVGKNAHANDLLTFKHSHKEDLWLHARDVSGSHVLIKYQSGKNFPKDVIEHAASLAAYNSKRRNDSLCPVIVTPKKFVRKRKGDPAGSVIVEKEDVVLVEPIRP